jgi:hypothetical protein
MAADDADVFHPDDIEANRRGELTDRQRKDFGALSGDRRRSAISSAAFLAAGALVVVVFASPTASPLLRRLVPAIALVLAVVLVLRSLAGSDPLTRDVKDGRVESIEGAVGKRRLSQSEPRGRTYFLDVGDASFMVASGTYEAAPDAGFVRVYFLPRSRRVVNLERLADRTPPGGEVTLPGILGSLRASFLSPGRREANDARAGLAGLGHRLEAAFAESATPPAEQDRDPRPLGEAILGTWTNPMMTVTFSGDGRVSATVRLLGTRREGHWSVHGGDRLRADITGQMATAEAWVAGNRLTIAAEGGGLTFTRESVE